MSSSQDIGSIWDQEILRFKFYSLCSEILKIQEFALPILYGPYIMGNT